MAMSQPTKEPTPSPRVAQLLAAGIALAHGLLRLVPHPWNFTPVGAVGLFSGGRLRSWYGFALPVGVMAVTDLLMWAFRGPDYSPFHVTRPFVYSSILLYAVLGRLLATADSPWRIGLASLLGSLQFFLVTNFGTWLFGMDNLGNPYPKTLEGLLVCYTVALPFFGPTVLSDLLYSAVLFGEFAVVLYCLSLWQPEARTEPEA